MIIMVGLYFKKVIVAGSWPGWFGWLVWSGLVGLYLKIKISSCEVVAPVALRGAPGRWTAGQPGLPPEL